MRETQFAPFVMEHGGRLSKSADKILRRLAALHEAKLLNSPPSNKLGPVGNRFLTMIRQIMSATLHKATSRRIRVLTVSDRVLFTQASRARDGGEFRVLDALTIAEAVSGLG